MPHLNN